MRVPGTIIGRDSVQEVADESSTSSPPPQGYPPTRTLSPVTPSNKSFTLEVAEPSWELQQDINAADRTRATSAQAGSFRTVISRTTSRASISSRGPHIRGLGLDPPSLAPSMYSGSESLSRFPVSDDQASVTAVDHSGSLPDYTQYDSGSTLNQPLFRSALKAEVLPTRARRLFLWGLLFPPLLILCALHLAYPEAREGYVRTAVSVIGQDISLGSLPVQSGSPARSLAGSLPEASRREGAIQSVLSDDLWRREERSWAWRGVYVIAGLAVLGLIFGVVGWMMREGK